MECEHDLYVCEEVADYMVRTGNYRVYCNKCDHKEDVTKEYVEAFIAEEKGRRG
jgi:hypothetical protein